MICSFIKKRWNKGKDREEEDICNLSGASYVLAGPKPFAPLGGLMLAHSEKGRVKRKNPEGAICKTCVNRTVMEEVNAKGAKGYRKGGRPKKAVKCDQKLTVMCTLIERKVIEAKAKLALLTVSEYVRMIALDRKVNSRQKVLPKEVLALTATLNHLAANVNQIAKKRNGIDELNALERAELDYLSKQLKALANDIKNYLK